MGGGFSGVLVLIVLLAWLLIMIPMVGQSHQRSDEFRRTKEFNRLMSSIAEAESEAVESAREQAIRDRDIYSAEYYRMRGRRRTLICACLIASMLAGAAYFALLPTWVGVAGLGVIAVAFVVVRRQAVQDAEEARLEQWHDATLGSNIAAEAKMSWYADDEWYARAERAQRYGEDGWDDRDDWQGRDVRRRYIPDRREAAWEPEPEPARARAASTAAGSVWQEGDWTDEDWDEYYEGRRVPGGY